MGTCQAQLTKPKVDTNKDKTTSVQEINQQIETEIKKKTPADQSQATLEWQNAKATAITTQNNALPENKEITGVNTGKEGDTKVELGGTETVEGNDETLKTLSKEEELKQLQTASEKINESITSDNKDTGLATIKAMRDQVREKGNTDQLRYLDSITKNSSDDIKNAENETDDIQKSLETRKAVEARLKALRESKEKTIGENKIFDQDAQAKIDAEIKALEDTRKELDKAKVFQMTNGAFLKLEGSDHREIASGNTEQNNKLKSKTVGDNYSDLKKEEETSKTNEQIYNELVEEYKKNGETFELSENQRLLMNRNGDNTEFRVVESQVDENGNRVTTLQRAITRKADGTWDLSKAKEAVQYGIKETESNGVDNTSSQTSVIKNSKIDGKGFEVADEIKKAIGFERTNKPNETKLAEENGSSTVKKDHFIIGQVEVQDSGNLKYTMTREQAECQPLELVSQFEKSNNIIS